MAKGFNDADVVEIVEGWTDDQRDEVYKAELRRSNVEILDRESMIELRYINSRYIKHCYMVNYHGIISRTTSTMALVSIAIIIYFK